MDTGGKTTESSSVVTSPSQTESKSSPKPSVASLRRDSIDIKTLIELQKKADVASQTIRKQIELRNCIMQHKSADATLSQSPKLKQQCMSPKSPAFKSARRLAGAISIKLLPKSVISRFHARNPRPAQKPGLAKTQSLQIPDFSAACSPRGVVSKPKAETKWTPKAGSGEVTPSPYSLTKEMEHWHKMNERISEILESEEKPEEETDFRSKLPKTPRQVIMLVKLSQPRYLKKVDPNKVRPKYQPPLVLHAASNDAL